VKRPTAGSQNSGAEEEEDNIGLYLFQFITSSELFFTEFPLPKFPVVIKREETIMNSG